MMTIKVRAIEVSATSSQGKIEFRYYYTCRNCGHTADLTHRTHSLDNASRLFGELLCGECFNAVHPPIGVLNSGKVIEGKPTRRKTRKLTEGKA
jgi:hypothetical protein